MCNFAADDISLSAIAKTVAELKNTLQSVSKVVINCFKNNKMIVITLDKQKYDYSNETIKFGNKTVETIASVRLLGVQLDDKLNYSLHFSNIFKSAPNQLNALIRLNNYLCFEGKKSFGR